jgi:hypothetical protein
LLTGELRDPMVGRDVLIGGLLGLVHTMGIYLGNLLPQWAGRIQPPNPGVDYDTLGGGFRALVMNFLADELVTSIAMGLAYLFFSASALHPAAQAVAGGGDHVAAAGGHSRSLLYQFVA